MQTIDSEQKRHIPSHSTITKFWKDLCITPYGEIINEKDKHKLDEYVLIDYYEPVCWCCGKIIYVEKEKQYQQILNGDDPFKVWDIASVRSHLNKCHIIPFSQGGSDDPSNLFLMCELCHRESPDFINPKYFFKYVYERRKNSIFFGMRKEEVYNLINYFQTICNTYNKDPNELIDIDLSTKKLNMGSHGGHISPYTIVSALCDLLPEKKSISIKYNHQK